MEKMIIKCIFHLGLMFCTLSSCISQGSETKPIESTNDTIFSHFTIIKSVVVNDEEAQDKVHFKDDEKNFEFLFSDDSLNSDNIQYMYMLDGFDTKWRYTRDHYVAYPKLKSGKYLFNVKANLNNQYITSDSYVFEIQASIYKSPLLKYILTLAILYLLWQWKQVRESNLRKSHSLDRLSIENQLINLQNQLNPHFLFNSFNTLISLIEEDPDKAVGFTEKLTDFYRLLLKHGGGTTISLNKEVSILKIYYSILKERFHNQLTLEFIIQKKNQYEIPTLTLQLLVENAVKHNTLSSKTPLIMTIEQDGEYLTVSNKINPIYGKSKGTGTGLVNILKRFELNDMEKPIIKREKDYFVVKMKLAKTNV